MKTFTLLTAIAVVEGLVLPDQNIFSTPNLKPKFEKDLPSHIYAAADYAAETWTEAFSSLSEKLADANSSPFTNPQTLVFGGNRHKKEFPDLTIYEGIKSCPALTKFTTAVDHYNDVKDVLDGGKKGDGKKMEEHHNHTLFVPVDEAFDHLPHHAGDKEPDWEDPRVKRTIEYHIVDGGYKAFDVLKANTLGSVLKEDKIGGNKQRLRPGVSLGGVKVNFYSKVISTDFLFKNGVVHAVNRVLIPPPTAAFLVKLFPAYFSTFLLAGEKANFTKEFLDKVKNLPDGRTLFVPDNSAWQKLGPKANAFLFNTEKGGKYLNAILRYHVVPNLDFYSDALYEGDGDDDKKKMMELKKRNAGFETEGDGEHHEFPTLLDDKKLSVDVGKWLGLKFVKINGFTNVKIRDGVAKDGVVHVVDKVLIPPHKHGKEGMEAERSDTEMSVEELKERVEPYLEK